MKRFDELDEITKHLKTLRKQEEDIISSICGEVNKYPFLVERNGKQYVNREAKALYCRRRDDELIPIQQQIFDLEKKNDEIIEELIQDGLIEVKDVEIIGVTENGGIPTVQINGKKKYRRIMIKLL